MIEYDQDLYEWVPGPREFRLIEDADLLIEIPALRLDIAKQRLADGWLLIASHPHEESAQLRLVDLWSRTLHPPGPRPQ